MVCYCSVSFHDNLFYLRLPVPGKGRGRGTALYKPNRHVPPQRVGCFRRFGLKTGIDFTHFGLESGMVFKGTTAVYERIYCFNSK